MLRGPDTDMPRPGSLGAAAAPTTTTNNSIINLCNISNLAPLAHRSAVAKILLGVSAPHKVILKDVGQANFVEIRDASDQTVLYYDVGLPISFNGHTVPKKIAFDLDNDAPVILSHWDWDHLQAAFRFPKLLERPWIVPLQNLGPGAMRLAVMLEARGNLHICSNINVSLPNIKLASCVAPSSNLNNSGIALLVGTESGKEIALVGDADYISAINLINTSVDYLIATHHGAKFNGGSSSVPAPSTSLSQYYISYGAGNVYRHPRQQAIADHSAAGWGTAITTAGQSAWHRGDRILGP